MQRYRVLLVVGIIVGAAFGVAAANYVLGDESGAPEAISLPTACENFVEASEIMAREGSHAAVPLTGGDVFAGDPTQRSVETLRALLESCDAELARAAD